MPKPNLSHQFERGDRHHVISLAKDARSILIRMETSMGHSARRRADLDRMKAKAVRFGKQWHQGDRKRHDGAFVEKCQKIANHLAICSGPCCGNPRRWFGELTMQERRASEIGWP